MRYQDSPPKQNSSLHGVGIVLYNDDFGDLRVLEIVRADRDPVLQILGF